VPARSGAPSDPLLDEALWSTRTMIALYRPGWSYRPADAQRAAAPGKENAKIASDNEISQEDLLFRIDPRISYVSDAFAETDQEFWRGKPAK